MSFWKKQSGVLLLALVACGSSEPQNASDCVLEKTKAGMSREAAMVVVATCNAKWTILAPNEALRVMRKARLESDKAVYYLKATIENNDQRFRITSYRVSFRLKNSRTNAEKSFTVAFTKKSIDWKEREDVNVPVELGFDQLADTKLDFSEVVGVKVR